MTILKRKDTHRPSAINPAEYEYVAVEVMKIESFGDSLAAQHERKLIQAHMKRTGGTYSRHQHGGNCMVCGANAVYTLLFYHQPTNSYVRTGSDCADKLAMGDEHLFKSVIERIKREVQDVRELKAGKMKAEALLFDRGLQQAWHLFNLNLKPEHQAELVAAGCGEMKEQITDRCPDCNGHGRLDASRRGDEDNRCEKCGGWGSRPEFERKEIAFVPAPEYFTLLDVIRKLIKWGSISDKQYDLLGFLVEKMAKRNEVLAKRAEEKAAAADCPSGRVEVEGEIIKAEWREGNYGNERKITVKHSSGYIVWGTAPSGLKQAERGDKVSFTATVTVSDRDSKFGFYKRPTGGKLLS